MQHTIPIQKFVDQIGPQAREMAHAVESCVHCGFCLAACPTYHVLGEEMDLPRGRIVLMKSVLEGDLDRGMRCRISIAAWVAWHAFRPARPVCDMVNW